MEPKWISCVSVTRCPNRFPVRLSVLNAHRVPSLRNAAKLCNTRLLFFLNGWYGSARIWIVGLAHSRQTPQGHWGGEQYWKNLGPVSWRSMAFKWWQFSQSNRHSTIPTRQTEYREVLPSSAYMQSHLTSSFADIVNASWYSVCQVPMVERQLDCENCHHLMVVGLHDTSPSLQYAALWLNRSLDYACCLWCFTVHNTCTGGFVAYLGNDSLWHPDFV